MITSIYRALRRAGAAALIASVACSPTHDVGRQGDSAPIVAKQPPGASTAPGEVAWMPHDAQLALDSARTAFVAGNHPMAANALRSAATFTRNEAARASDDVKKALVGSANELDRLAAEVESKHVSTVRRLDLAFAREHLAEAELHHARAADAWKRADTDGAASELDLLTDHLERAAKDARQTLDTAATRAIAEARAIATKLARHAAVIPAEVDAVLNNMARELHAFATRLPPSETKQPAAAR